MTCFCCQSLCLWGEDGLPCLHVGSSFQLGMSAGGWHQPRDGSLRILSVAFSYSQFGCLLNDYPLRCDLPLLSAKVTPTLPVSDFLHVGIGACCPLLLTERAVVGWSLTLTVSTAAACFFYLLMYSSC